MTLGYKSKYHRTRWQSFKAWALSAPSALEQCLFYACVAFACVIGLEVAIVSIFNAVYWGL